MSDSDSEVHGSSNGESDFEGFSATDVRKAASARGRRAARPSTSTAVPMDTDDSSESEWDSDCSTRHCTTCSARGASAAASSRQAGKRLCRVLGPFSRDTKAQLVLVYWL